jgi:hypothetical protein
MKQPRVRKFTTTEPNFDIIAAMDHPGLFKPWFAGESWDVWRVILKAAFCLPMTEAEIETFRTVAGDRDPPRTRVKELWIIAGRRAGKDSIASLIVAFASVFFRVGLDKLRPGEKALCQCLACDRHQARLVLNYVRAFFQLLPPLRDMVVRQTTDGLELQNDVSIEVGTNSYKAVRGRAILVSVLDEVAYYADETSARPDVETYNAVKPGLATLPGAMLIGISSPHRKSGLLHSKFKKHFGQDDDDTLVIKAPTWVLNPTIDQAIIDKAFEEDPQVARAEWGAEFRDDISGFVDADVVAACVATGVRELPAARGIRYFAFLDPSGGSSDSMTLAVAHREAEQVVLDCLCERRPPFSPQDVCIEFSACLRSYGIGNVQSDKYGGIWPVEAFAPHGIRVEQAAAPKSDLYVNLLPLLNSRRLVLLDHPRLINQLSGLERRTARGGRDSIDHAPGGHDDLANAVAGVAALAMANQGVVISKELLRRTLMLPPRPERLHSAWSGRKRMAALAAVGAIPASQQSDPRGALAASKFQPNPSEEGEQ